MQVVSRTAGSEIKDTNPTVVHISILLLHFKLHDKTLFAHGQFSAVRRRWLISLKIAYIGEDKLSITSITSVHHMQIFAMNMAKLSLISHFHNKVVAFRYLGRALEKYLFSTKFSCCRTKKCSVELNLAHNSSVI